MPIGAAITGAAVVGAGASIYGSSKASKAASKASDKNAQIQQEQYNQTRADLQPYAQAGNTALSALQQRLGLSAPTAAPANNTRTSVPGQTFGGYGGTSMAGTTGVASPDAPAGWGPGALDGAYANVNVHPSSTQATSPNGSFAGTLPAVGVGMQNFAQPAAASAPTSGQPNWDQLLQDRPDVMAEYQRASAAGDRNSPAYARAGLTSPQDYAAHWYNDMGGSNSYQPQSSGTMAAPMPAASDASTIPGQTFTSANNGGLGDRGDGGLGDRATLARPGFTEQQPTIGAGPSSATYVDPANFTTSPGYQFRLNEGIRNLNAGYGAKGLLKSGSAMQGIVDYGQGQASSEYGNWFNQQMSRLGADQNQFNNDRSTGLAQYNQNRNVFNTNYNADTARYDSNYNTDRARYDQNFNSDRGYNTDQYNTYTGNLFNMAGIGQSAAAGTAAAGQNYAAGMTANNNNLASVQGNAAIAGANGINSAINTGVQAYGAYSNPFSVNTGASGPINGVSYNVNPF